MKFGSHPLNLALRFLLEMAALVGVGLYGWGLATPWRFVAVVGLPLFFAFLWGTFAVPQDPSRSGRAPVPVSGPVRLALEFAVFLGGLWGLLQSGWSTAAGVYTGFLLIHYALSADRLRWLLRSDGE